MAAVTTADQQEVLNNFFGNLGIEKPNYDDQASVGAAVKGGLEVMNGILVAAGQKPFDLANGYTPELGKQISDGIATFTSSTKFDAIKAASAVGDFSVRWLLDNSIEKSLPQPLQEHPAKIAELLSPDNVKSVIAAFDANKTGIATPQAKQEFAKVAPAVVTAAPEQKPEEPKADTTETKPEEARSGDSKPSEAATEQSVEDMAKQEVAGATIVFKTALRDIGKAIGEQPAFIQKKAGFIPLSDESAQNIAVMDKNAIMSGASAISLLKGFAGVDPADGYYDKNMRVGMESAILSNDFVLKKLGSGDVEVGKENVTKILDSLDKLSEQGALYSTEFTAEQAKKVTNGAQIQALTMGMDFILPFVSPEDLDGFLDAINNFIKEASGGRFSLDGVMEKLGMPSREELKDTIEDLRENVDNQAYSAASLDKLYNSFIKEGGDGLNKWAGEFLDKIKDKFPDTAANLKNLKDAMNDARQNASEEHSFGEIMSGYAKNIREGRAYNVNASPKEAKPVPNQGTNESETTAPANDKDALSPTSSVGGRLGVASPANVEFNSLYKPGNAGDGVLAFNSSSENVRPIQIMARDNSADMAVGPTLERANALKAVRALENGEAGISQEAADAAAQIREQYALGSP